MQAQIEEATFNIKHLTMALHGFTETFETENMTEAMEAVSCTHAVSSYILKELKRITDTF